MQLRKSSTVCENLTVLVALPAKQLWAPDRRSASSRLLHYEELSNALPMGLPVK